MQTGESNISEILPEPDLKEAFQQKIYDSIQNINFQYKYNLTCWAVNDKDK